MARDYYEILGLARGASAADIKSAYRKLAKQYHPDRQKDDDKAEARFKEIGEAYGVLKDEEKRRAYDQLGHAAFTQGGFGNAAGGEGFGGGQGFGQGFSANMGDMFEELFGAFGGRQSGQSGRAQAQRARGEDLRLVVEISLQEAFTGDEKELVFSAPAPCSACKATGSATGKAAEACPRCGGEGSLHSRQGFFTFSQTCPACGGEGRLIADPCSQCGGGGRANEKRKVRVKIPAGIEDEAQLRLTGKGAAGTRGQPPGDLLLLISVKPHPFFTRQGSDLACEIRTSFTEAVLGGEGRLKTLAGGTLKVKIPEGVQAGHVLRLSGQGMPRVGGGGARGDLHVRLKLETPVKLSTAQKDLLRQFRASESEANRPAAKGFFARAREFFETLRG